MNANQTADERILSLFENAQPFGKPKNQWLANEQGAPPRLALIRRVPPGLKGRATEALALSHEHIAPPTKWLADEERPGEGVLYLCRDVIKGKSLRQTVESSPNPPDAHALRRYLLPVLDALQYAHARGVEHGGVSAENVFVREDGQVLLTDFVAADPNSNQHREMYNGVADAGGDVRALSRLVVTYLPTVGAFSDPNRRARLVGITSRCTSLAVLREILNTLEIIAGGSGASADVADDGSVRLKPIGVDSRTGAPAYLTLDAPTEPDAVVENPDAPAPRLVFAPQNANVRVASGAGGTMMLQLRNTGTAPLVVRMVATEQRHTWLNAPTVALPILLGAGESRPLLFGISAARLAPGDYRSVVYLAANARSPEAEGLGNGFWKHTCEVRVTVF